jgi:integrase
VVAEAVRHPEWGGEWTAELLARGKAVSTVKSYLSGVAKACAIVAPELRPAWTAVVAAAGTRTLPPPRGFGEDAERLILDVRQHAPEAGLVLDLILATGARIGELVPTRRAGDHHLVADRLLGADQILLVGKGGLERIRSLPPALYAELAERAEALADEAPVFAVTDRDVQRALRQACARLGIAGERKGPHGLRYDYATRSRARRLEEGLDEEAADRAVSRELGHRRPAITHHYLRTT